MTFIIWSQFDLESLSFRALSVIHQSSKYTPRAHLVLDHIGRMEKVPLTTAEELEAE